MKNTNIITIIVAALLFVTSCAKQSTPDGANRVGLTFEMASGPVSDLRAASEPLPEGTVFKVLVFEPGANIASAVPVEQGNYTVVNAAGQAIPVIESDRIDLVGGNYDLYFVSPAPADYKNIEALSGQDFMAASLSNLSVEANANGQFIVPVQMARMASRIDIEFVGAANSFVTDLAIGTMATKISGLAVKGNFTLGGTQITGVTGNTAFGEIATTQFANTTPSILTSVAGKGIVTLSGILNNVTIEGQILVDGVVTNVDITLPTVTLEAGKKHLITITFDKLGLVEATVSSVEPWIEGGVIGGGEAELV